MYIRGKYTSSAQVIDFNLSGVIVYYPPTIVVYVHCVLLCLWCHISLLFLRYIMVVVESVHHLPNKANLAL